MMYLSRKSAGMGSGSQKSSSSSTCDAAAATRLRSARDKSTPESSLAVRAAARRFFRRPAWRISRLPYPHPAHTRRPAHLRKHAHAARSRKCGCSAHRRVCKRPERTALGKRSARWLSKGPGDGQHLLKVRPKNVGGCAPLFSPNSSLAKGRPAGRLPLRCGRIARRHTRRDPGADAHGVRHLPYPHP